MNIDAQQIIDGEVEATPEDLVKILTEASDLYYNDGESFLSDADYDTLERMLRELDPKNLYLTTVGSDVRGGKIDLPFPMGSLDQCYEGDTIEWVRKNGWENELFVISYKQDGTSALNIHSGHGLKISYSRGNGFQGADITRHMKRIKRTPDSKINAAVRVEVIMEEEVFQSQKAEAEANGGRVYKNSRNYVAGRMNASESPDIFYDTVRVIGTSVVEPKMSKLDQFELLSSMGYEVTPYITAYGRELTDEFLLEALALARDVSPTPLDGLVIDLNDADLRASLRRKSSSINPMYSRKFKAGADENVAIVTVKQVHWKPSKSGYLKPRVEIEPVDLVGVTITYATGFNAKFICTNEIGPGAKIQITRSGDVIPFIQKVISKAPGGAQLPSKEVFGELTWTDGDVDLVLLDPERNPEVQMELINSVFGGLDVPFLRKSTIEKLYSAGYSSARDIIIENEEALQDIIGESAGSKIYHGIREKLNPVDLGILAGATSLLGRGIGRRKMSKLLEALGNEPILNGTVTVDQIVPIEGFDIKTAKVIVENLPKFLKFLSDIDGYYTIKEKVSMSGDLNGVTVVFTGIRDKELEAKIEARGGKIGSGVSKTTNYLVAKDPTGGSGKLVKARELIGAENIISITDAKERWG